jgi:hypothetical protein
MLKLYPNIAIYGYTANSTTSKYETSRNIAQAILSLRIKYKKRFSIRYSNDLKQEFSANSEELQTPQKDKSIQCPEQIGLTDSCGTCGLCWEQPKRQVIFKTH